MIFKHSNLSVAAQMIKKPTPASMILEVLSLRVIALR